MEWLKYNANPKNNRVGDCTVRAISTVLNQKWETTYVGLCVKGLELADMPSANHVWGSYLRDLGFCRQAVPDTCPDCYTVADFCNEHPDGKYILALNKHVVAVISGTLFDTWDSSDEIVLYFWKKET